MPGTSPINTAKNKKRMLKALEVELGIVTKACKTAGITPKTHFLWLQKDPEYKKAYDDIDIAVLDFVESALFKKIKSGDTACIIFYMKCRAKKRGYIEREIDNKEMNTLTGIKLVL